MDDFLEYLESVGKAQTTVNAYRSDLNIFFVWVLQNADNKYFPDISKRDIIAYQNWLIKNNENSPARVRRLKSAISSLSNYIESILDDELPNFRSIVRKIESPVNEPVREKTVLTEEQTQMILDELVKETRFEEACFFALALYSGRRKSELLRFKVSYFTDENIIYGTFYKTPEKIRTKGMGANGKMLTCYVLVKPFKPYFDLWMKERQEKSIESEWLFPNKNDFTQHADVSVANRWAELYSRISGLPVYLHSARHFFTSQLARANVPDSVIQAILGWSDISMVSVYKDIDQEEEIGKYFKDGEIIGATPKDLSQL